MQLLTIYLFSLRVVTAPCWVSIWRNMCSVHIETCRAWSLLWGLFCSVYQRRVLILELEECVLYLNLLLHSSKSFSCFLFCLLLSVDFVSTFCFRYMGIVFFHSGRCGVKRFSAVKLSSYHYYLIIQTCECCASDALLVKNNLLQASVCVIVNSNHFRHPFMVTRWLQALRRSQLFHVTVCYM